jgi:hypothetical protein
MASTPSQRLLALASGRNVLLALILFIALAAGVLPRAEARLLEYSGGRGPLDLRATGYSAEEALATVEALGPEGRSFYATVELTADVLYPAVYTAFLVLLLAWALRRAAPVAGHPAHRLLVLPFLVAGVDLLENAAIVTLLLSHPSAPAGVASAAGVLTVIKWGLLALTGVVILATLGAAGLRALKARGGMRP